MCAVSVCACLFVSVVVFVLPWTRARASASDFHVVSTCKTCCRPMKTKVYVYVKWIRVAA